MTPKDIVRFIVRLQSAVFLFYAVLDLTYIGPYYRSFRLTHEYLRADTAAAQNFAMAILRIGLNVLAAYVLYARTDKVIHFLLGRGTNVPDPDPSPTTSRGVEPSAE